MGRRVGILSIFQPEIAADSAAAFDFRRSLRGDCLSRRVDLKIGKRADPTSDTDFHGHRTSDIIVEFPSANIAPLAQLDRASGYEPEGREFESLRAHHFSTT